MYSMKGGFKKNKSYRLCIECGKTNRDSSQAGCFQKPLCFVVNSPTFYLKVTGDRNLLSSKGSSVLGVGTVFRQTFVEDG